MWCQVSVSQENLCLEACSGSREFMCPCFCSTYFILFRQIKVRDGKRNVCISASAQCILHSSHNKVYGWVRNVSTLLINALIYNHRASWTNYLHLSPLIDCGSLQGCWSPHLVWYVQLRLALQPLLQQHPLALHEGEEKKRKRVSFYGSHFRKVRLLPFILRAPLTTR